MSKDALTLAQECGINFHQAGWPELERLVQLVRADEREKYKWDVHSCGPTCKRYACVAMREAIAAEREAILDLVDSYAKNNLELVAAIRARSNS